MTKPICRATVLRDRQPEQCATPTDGFICTGCLRNLEKAIAEMPSLMHEVSLLATKQTRVYRANGKSDHTEELKRWDAEQRRVPAMLRSKEGRIALPETQAMISLPARQLLYDADNMLATWARHLHETRDIAWFPWELRHYTGPTHAPSCDHDTCLRMCGHESCAQIIDSPQPAPPVTMQQVIGWLLTNLEAVRFDEAGDQMHNQIIELRRDMRRAVDRSPSAVFAGPCEANVGHLAEAFDDMVTAGRCRRDLYAWDGQLEIVCDGYRSPDEHDTGCGARFTLLDRQEWLQRSARESLVSITEILEALPQTFPDLIAPPRSVFTAWVRQGRLMARGRNHIGDDTFLGGEMLDLIKAYRPHKYAPRPSRQRQSA